MDDLFGSVKLDRGRISDQIVNEFRKLIKQGTLKPGQKIPGEHDLAERFSTSRGTIREALRTLETMGLLEIKSGSGAYVRELPLSSGNLDNKLQWLLERRESVLELMEVRQVLQGRAAKLCAENIGESQLQTLNENIQTMMRAKEDNDAEALTEIDTHFHYLIGEYCGNKILDDLIKYVEETYRISSRALMDLSGRAMRSVEEHTAVFEAIKAGDGPLAEKKMHDHTDSVRADILALDEEVVTGK